MPRGSCESVHIKLHISLMIILFCFSQKSHNKYWKVVIGSDFGSHTRRQAEVHKQTANLCVDSNSTTKFKSLCGAKTSKFIIRCSCWHIPHDFFIPLSINSYDNRPSNPIPSASLSRNRSSHISLFAFPPAQRERLTHFKLSHQNPVRSINTPREDTYWVL